MSATLTIQCAKPDCHWSGPPSEAAGHACPVPAEDAATANGATAETTVDAGPFAGMTNADGEPIAGATDDSHRYRVVWADGHGKTVVIGSAADEEGALELSGRTDAGKGSVEIQDLGPVQALEEPATAAEPETREELEAWLLEHGDYDDVGAPTDAATARYDARLGALQEAAGEEPEPPLDEISETVEGEEVEPELEAQVGEATDEPRDAIEVAEGETGELDAAIAAGDLPAAETEPWETQIAAVLATQTAVKDYRWLLISKDDDAGTAELIGRARVKSEAEELLVATESQGELPGLEIVKTKDVLDAVAEIEKRRENVEEPDTVVEAPETPQEPQDEPPALPDDDEIAETGKTVPDASGGLFDADAYRSESLAIPRVDGQEIQRIALDFSGSIMLDRSKEGDVELYNRFALFAERELWISAKATGTGAKGATNKEGDLDVVVGRKSLKVESVRVIAPEELGRMEALEAFRFAVRRALKADIDSGDLFADLETIANA